MAKKKLRAVYQSDRAAIFCSVDEAILFQRASSMLALLEKAWPIIEVEAMNREEGGMLRDGEPVMGKYFTEMRELANEISTEIDRARGKGVSDG